MLSRGLTLRGVVLAEGVGVAQARVFASSSLAGAESVSDQSNARGQFTLQGLLAGRYTVSARGPEGGEAKLEDVDVENAGVLRLSLRREPTAVLSGKVVGLSSRDDVGTISIEAQSEGGRGWALADPMGSFRMEEAPTGNVRVSAEAATQDGNSRSSRVTELMLEPGSETQTVIEFSEGVTISGRVTSEGEPVAHASVSFQAAGAAGRASASADPVGRYAVAGLEPGLYEVSVSGQSVTFETRYEVTGEAQLDIDVTPVALHGRSVDATSGARLPKTSISLWSVGAGGNRPLESATTNAGGEFTLRTSSEGRYRVLATSDGYGHATQELELQRGENPPVLLELQPSEGLSIAVVDARNRRALAASVVVRDATRRIVANEQPGVGPGRHADHPAGTRSVPALDVGRPATAP